MLFLLPIRDSKYIRIGCFYIFDIILKIRQTPYRSVLRYDEKKSSATMTSADFSISRKIIAKLRCRLDLPHESLPTDIETSLGK